MAWKDRQGGSPPLVTGGWVLPIMSLILRLKGINASNWGSRFSLTISVVGQRLFVGPVPPVAPESPVAPVNADR